jgi:hypothetical protein
MKVIQPGRKYITSNGIYIDFDVPDAKILRELNSLGGLGPEIMDIVIDRYKAVKRRLSSNSDCMWEPGQKWDIDFKLTLTINKEK